MRSLLCLIQLLYLIVLIVRLFADIHHTRVL